MKIEEQFEVPCSIEQTYDELNDVGGIGYCIAGVQEVKVISETESQWKIEQRFGFMARTFKLNARITERRPPEKIAFAAHGQDVALSGNVVLKTLGPHQTSCEVVIEADVTGPMAPLVDMMAKGPQDQLIRQTIENIRVSLTEDPSVSSPAARSMPPSARPSFWQRLRAWLRRLIPTRSGRA